MTPDADSSARFKGLARALNEFGYTLKASDYERLFHDAGGNDEEFVDLILTAEGFDLSIVSPKAKSALVSYINGGPTLTWDTEIN